MGISGSSKSTTTSSNTSSGTSTSAPLTQYQPYIDQALGGAQSAFQANQANMPNLGTAAMGVYNGLAPAAATLGSIYSGTNPAQTNYTKLQSVGANDPSMGALQGSITAATANPALTSLEAMTNGGVNGDTSQYYQDVIGGKYLTNNPYIDNIAQQATDAATKAQNQRFALSGMDAGISTPFSQALGTAVANANNQVRYQNYNDERQLQNTAAGMSDAQYNATKDRNLSAATNLGSIYNQGIQNRTAAATALGSQYANDNATSLAATNGLSSSQLQALGLMPTMAGSQLGALAASASLPYANASAYANLVNGLTAKYGTNSGTSTSNGTDTKTSSPGLFDWMNLFSGAAKSAAAMGA